MTAGILFLPRRNHPASGDLADSPDLDSPSLYFERRHVLSLPDVQTLKLFPMFKPSSDTSFMA